jgi:hypothetical protein
MYPIIVLSILALSWIDERRPRTARPEGRIVPHGVGLLAVCLLVGAGLVACGGTRPALPSPQSHVTGRFAAVQARLRAAGYTVKDDVTFGGPLPAARTAFSVHDVEFASPHAFSVAVYGFGSRPAASRFAGAAYAVLASVASVPSHQLTNDRRVQVAGALVYVGFTEMDAVVCAFFGLCAAYRSYGVPTCVMTAAGAFRCTPVPSVPRDALGKLVGTAEGR